MIDHVKHSPGYPTWWGHDNWEFRPVGYYFWDEAGTECYGPFTTREECSESMEGYADSLETDDNS